MFGYRRPTKGKNGLRKRDFKYDANKDCYTHPMGQPLIYSTTTTGIAYISGGKIDVANNTLKFDAVTDKSQKINELVIDGKTLTVFDIQKMKSYQDESKDKNEIFDITENGVKGKVGSLPTRKLGDDFAQMRFGYVTDENGKSTLFVQGVQTPTEESIKSPFSYYRVDVEGETENIRE
ncbi:hypothetical protein ACWIW6_06900 [Ursidibacter sp. B-7004-1]